MIKLSLPNYLFLNTYNVCLQHCVSTNLPAMIGLRQQIPGYELLYRQRASNTTLHQSPHARHGHSEDIVIGSVTKADFVDLYDESFVKSKGGRAIYDTIKASSNGLCPLCGVGHVTTLDHYLPKARYPLYSVHPHNLVPACKDCNTGKGSPVLRSSIEEPLHPYFVAQHFIDEHWISAEIVETRPVTARFYPTPPDTWSQDCQQRAVNHFNGFGLASRYKTQASLLFTMLTDKVSELKHEQDLSTQDIQAHFLARSQNQPPNSIARTLMGAIAQSEWFCSEQYLV